MMIVSLKCPDHQCSHHHQNNGKDNNTHDCSVRRDNSPFAFGFEMAITLGFPNLAKAQVIQLPHSQ